MLWTTAFGAWKVYYNTYIFYRGTINHDSYLQLNIVEFLMKINIYNSYFLVWKRLILEEASNLIHLDGVKYRSWLEVYLKEQSVYDSH